jgi:hypothetical protein
MIELEADDALASAAHLAARDGRVERVCIWTPDKDLAQCVVGDRVVQMDRKTNTIRNAEGVRAKYESILKPFPISWHRRYGRRIPGDRGHRQSHGRAARGPLRPH